MLLCASIASVLIAVAFALGWFESFELKTIDWRTRVQTPAGLEEDGPIAIVAISEKDLRLLGERWPLPRKRYAELVDALSGHGAAAIAFGMALPGAAHTEQEDQELARACRAAGNVVLSAYSSESPTAVCAAYDEDTKRHNVGKMLANSPVVTEAAAAVGHLNVLADMDGTVRRVPAAIEQEGAVYAPLGVVAAAVYRGDPEMPRRFLGAADGRGCLWISYRDPRGSINLREDGGLLRRAGIDLQKPIELYSLHEVLGRNERLPEDCFKNKVVLIGCALNGVASAQHTTPFGRQHGVFVQAAIIDTALNGAPLCRVPWGISMLATVFVTVACGVLFSRLEGGAVAVSYALIVVLILAASFGALGYNGLMADITPPIAGATLSCASALLIGLGMARVEITKRNRELDAILEAGTASVELVGPELTGSHPLGANDRSARIIRSVVIPEKTPQIVANTVGQAMRASGCLLYIRDERTRRMLPAASYGFGAHLNKTQCMAGGHCLNHHVLEAGHPVLVSGSKAKKPPCLLPPAARSLLLIPLAIGGETVGTIQLFNKEPLSPADDGTFRQDDLRIATILGCQSAVSLQNAQLYLERHDLFLDFVEAIATSVDLKDRYTHGHSKRVAQHSVGIAAELGLPKVQTEMVALAARLHDVGKIGTPDLLLRKRGRLTQQEFEVIKAHTTNAERLFTGKPGWQTLVPGIRHHHERFNSTGYPDGLRGRRIPVAARIIAVADAFDAMTSDRPYRARMSPVDACEEVKACSGTQFDPRVAAAFLRYYRRTFDDAAQSRRRQGDRGRPRPLGAAAG